MRLRSGDAVDATKRKQMGISVLSFPNAVSVHSVPSPVAYVSSSTMICWMLDATRHAELRDIIQPARFSSGLCVCLCTVTWPIALVPASHILCVTLVWSCDVVWW